jgi:hypothetical protein
VLVLTPNVCCRMLHARGRVVCCTRGHVRRRACACTMLMLKPSVYRNIDACSTTCQHEAHD